jgi:transposase
LAKDRLCEERGIELIAPHRRNRTRPPTRDGRPLRRYKRRWKIERLFAWLHNFRRLIVPPAATESPEHERAPRDYTPRHLADKILQSSR